MILCSKHLRCLALVVLYLCFVGMPHLLWADDCDISLTATATSSTCLANAVVTTVVTGTDITLIDLTSAQYKIQSMEVGGHSTGFGNSSVFTGVPPGAYTVSMRAFCIKANAEVDYHSTLITVTGNYQAPDLYVVNRDVRKTLNAKVTGMIPVAFSEGLPPYKTTFTNAPAAYNGPMDFTLASAGTLEIDNLPEGDYYLTLSDNCNASLPVKVTIGKVASDFPSGLSANAYTSYPDCKTMELIIWESAITSTHELYPYLKNVGKFYDLVLNEDASSTELPASVFQTSLSSNGAVTSYRAITSLGSLSYKDLYPNGGHTANLRFKLKGVDSYSTSFPLSLFKPIASEHFSQYTCDGVAFYALQSTGYYGLICYPYKVEVFENGTSTLVLSKTGITSSASQLVGNIPYGEYKIVYTGADGGTWGNTVVNLAKPTYSGSYYWNSWSSSSGVCSNITQTNLNVTIYASAYYNNFFIDGTTITVKSAPEGQTIPASQTVTGTRSSVSFGPDLLAGTYVIEVNNKCDPPTQITIVAPPAQTSTTSVYYSTDRSNSCLSDNPLHEGYSYFYLNGGNKLPAGSTVKYTGGTGAPASVIHKNTTIAAATLYFNPFANDSTNRYETANITSGTYTFDVWHSECNTTTSVTLYGPTYFSVKDFAYTSEQTCGGLMIYPTGSLQCEGYLCAGTYTQFRIQSAISTSGLPITDYDKSTIPAGQSLLLQKSGTYILQMISSNYCSTKTLTINYKQPTPQLDFAKTAAYVCGGETKGYIKLVASGGFDAGPYKYEIVGTNLSNFTGVFDYGAPNQKVTIRIWDYSDKANTAGCNPYIEQTVNMLDLTDASITYTSNSGIVCVGGTIELNCVSLGGTTYTWRNPNGDVISTEQFFQIHDATPAMSGDYTVTVQPENCSEIMVQKISIIVRKPAVPVLQHNLIELCLNAPAPSFLAATGATALSGHTLKWYQNDGVSELTFHTINTSSAYTATYYVCQVLTATGCEGTLMPFTVSILALPDAPMVLTPEAKCWGTPLVLIIEDTRADYIYKVYEYTDDPIYTLPGNGGQLMINGQYGINYGFSISATDSKGCVSNPRTNVPIPIPPTISQGEFITTRGCPGETTTIATNNNWLEYINPIYTWYNMEGAIVHVGDTYALDGLTEEVCFRVNIAADGMCETPVDYRPGVCAKPLPYVTLDDIYIYNNSTCEGESARPTIVFADVMYGTVVSWYASQTETVPFWSEEVYNWLETSSYQTPLLTKDTTYYIEITNPNEFCPTPVGERIEVVVSVAKKAAAEDIAICPNTMATIVVNNVIEYGYYEIYDAPYGNVITSFEGGASPTVSIDLGVHTTDATYYILDQSYWYCYNQEFKPVNVRIQHPPTVYEDIRLQVCPQTGIMLDLNQHLNPIDLAHVDWTSQSGITLEDGHKLNVADLSPGGTYSFGFKASNDCYPSKDARLYVKALAAQKHYSPIQIKICKDLASQLVLTQMMGLVEVPGGVWDYGSLAPNSADYIQTVNGVLVFDGAKAYLDGKGVDYLAIPGARLITIQYTEPANACGPATTSKLDIILTPDLL